MRILSPFALLLLAAPLFAQGFTPDEAVKRMTLPEGFSVRAVATEPMIRQPLSMSFDNRGRLWVLQYLQYPNPAGLKAVKQDQYLRTTWDKVPEAPPKGPKGLDKITICYDPDENGVFRKSKDFLTGLNLACGFCLGHKRIYVVQPPYLLEYEDLNEDDVPDGDPKVLLTGFGMDDTHSLANNLQWGPDGWLYGAAGSTSTSKIKDPSGTAKDPIEFQQGIWRYHVRTKRFELFSEGGGNTYGLDFDKDGQAIAGTNFGHSAMLHQRQGAYHVKGFSKHGPLHNPYAYGYFDHVPYKGFVGGHVTCGGIVYQSDVYPKEFRNQYIAGNLLSNTVNWHKLTPKLSSFTAEHGGTLLDSHDTWHRPVDLIQGPDGCVYVADWYDKRAAHLDPVDDWDKTNGRIYRIEYKGMKKQEPFDLRKKSVKELVDLLMHENVWWRREARMLLWAARDENRVDLSKVLKDDSKPVESFSLEHGWAGGIGFINEHSNDESKLEWVIRYSTDLRDIGWMPARIPPGSHRLLAQCASSAKRAKLADAIEMLGRILAREELAEDPALPLLTWWAVEQHLLQAADDIGALVAEAAMENRGALPVYERTIRKLVAAGGRHAKVGYQLIAIGFLSRNTEFHSAAFHAAEAALDDGFGKSRSLIVMLKEATRDERTLRLLAKCGDAEALRDLRAIVTDSNKPEGERLKWLSVLAKAGGVDWKPLGLLEASKTDAWRIGILAAVESDNVAETPAVLLKLHAESSPAVRARIVRTLLARPAWALALFQAYDAGKLPKDSVGLDDAKLAVAFGDKALTPLVEKHFGKFSAAAPGEKRARIDSLNTMLGREKPGDPAAGKSIFAKNCAACHTLYGEGGKIGPDLSTADRKNRYYLLTHIVDPSAYIRPEFVSHKIDLLDGRTATGVVTAQSAESLTLSFLMNDKPEVRVMPRSEIDKVEPLAVSLMPEKMLDTLRHDEIRNLFAYVQSDPKPGDAKKKFRIALISGSVEYKSDDSLIGFQKLLEEKYPVECVRMFRKSDTDIEGLDKLAECDLAIFFTRRLKPDDKQLTLVKKYVESGKPILGIRTASHGFQNWLEMDKEVYGGNYKNHNPGGPKCEVTLVEKQKDRPILKGVKPYSSASSLYKNTGLADDVTVLLMGAIPKESEPLAWTRERKLGEKTQRIFYTSLGHTDDFAEASFRRLVVNAIGWCVRDEKSFAE